MAKIALTTWLPALAGLLLFGPVAAHPPDWASHPVLPRIDVIPPLGNNLPLSYSARYNRPPYVPGKIAYWIAPSTREAMSWHRSAHRGYYANHAPRMETHYLFPKPWEVLGLTSKVSPLPAVIDGLQPVEMPGAIPAPGIELAPPIELLPPPALD